MPLQVVLLLFLVLDFSLRTMWVDSKLASHPLCSQANQLVIIHASFRTCGIQITEDAKNLEINAPSPDECPNHYLITEDKVLEMLLSVIGYNKA